MNQPYRQLSKTALIVNLLLCVFTVFWCVPFGIYLLMGWSTKRKPSLMIVAMHTILTALVLPPLYGICIIIYYVYKKK